MSFPLPIVLILLSTLVIGTTATILWYRKNPGDTKLLKILALLQLAEFLAVNIWYRVAGYLAFPLPLFHCRLAKIFMILFAFLPRKYRKTMRPLLVYSLGMAIFGAISSFVYPDPDPFLWPHITHIGYFFGHFNLMLFATAFLAENTEPFKGKDLRKAQILLLATNVLILPIARSTGINYSYLLKSPLFNEPLQAFGPNIYVLIMILVYSLLFTVAFGVMTLIEKQTKKRKIT